MESSKALIPVPLSPAVWSMIEAVAPAMHKARFYNVSSPEQAMAIMLTGHELGLGLAASLEFVRVVQGKPTLIPRGALALIQSNPLCAEIKIEDLVDGNGDPGACRVHMKRTNGFEYTTTFSMADAARAGLIKKDSGWEGYPANMLRWRAIGFCADVVFSDILGGLKRADEFGAAISPDGDVIEGQWRAVTSTPTETPAPAIEAPPVTEPASAILEISLSDLVARYGAEQVMVAAGGRIPGSDEEVAAVAQKLGACNA